MGMCMPVISPRAIATSLHEAFPSHLLATDLLMASRKAKIPLPEVICHANNRLSCNRIVVWLKGTACVALSLRKVFPEAWKSQCLQREKMAGTGSLG
eukprot:2844738-Amphidinium_carterae.1